MLILYVTKEKRRNVKLTGGVTKNETKENYVFSVVIPVSAIRYPVVALNELINTSAQKTGTLSMPI